MSVKNISVLLTFLLFLLQLKPICSFPSPYLSPSTFLPNFQDMMRSFKIFIYNTSQDPIFFNSPSENLFHKSLLESRFLTRDPNRAHLFFVPFPSSLPARSITRLIRSLRIDLPYWNRTLGADHFYLSCNGLTFDSDRNLLELKKNSVQISCFPAVSGRFVPHKDVTLPPVAHPPGTATPPSPARGEYLGYLRHNAVKETCLVEELGKDPKFLVESQPSDETTWRERMGRSEFCLFEYGEGDMSSLSAAMRFGCVPVVIADRPMQDLPLIDVLRWQEIGLFLGKEGGAEGLKGVLGDLANEGARIGGMRESGAEASRHLLWNGVPQPLDAFHSVVYQLWLRRHTIRYARREVF